jgi:hypothetical protein
MVELRLVEQMNKAVLYGFIKVLNQLIFCHLHNFMEAETPPIVFDT